MGRRGCCAARLEDGSNPPFNPRTQEVCTAAPANFCPHASHSYHRWRCTFSGHRGRRTVGQRRRLAGAGPHGRCRHHHHPPRLLWRPPRPLERGARHRDRRPPQPPLALPPRCLRAGPAHSPCQVRPNPPRARRARSRATYASEPPTGPPSGACGALQRPLWRSCAASGARRRSGTPAVRAGVHVACAERAGPQRTPV